MNEVAPKRDWFYWFVVLFTASQAAIAVLIVLDFVLHPLAPDHLFHSPAFRLFSMLIVVPLSLFIAILVIRRNPHNLTGLFLLQWALSNIATTVRPETAILYSLSLGWIGLWFLPIYFPDGRAFPHRLEGFIRFLFVGFVIIEPIWILSTPSFSVIEQVNPYFVPNLSSFNPLVSIINAFLLFATILVILPSIALRYRQSNLHAKQQIKWFVWVFLLVIVVTLPIGLSGISSGNPQRLPLWEQIILILWSSYITTSPFIVIAYAILRHKLYDIDIIIRRTLIYSILSAILAGVYFGTVILVQQVFQSATGEVPDFAIVLSTLLIAALFNPIRNRIQAQIDRRFYRRKYDVEQTLAEFQQNLREEVDMPTLQANLVTVVNETMQPSSIRLWVKE